MIIGLTYETGEHKGYHEFSTTTHSDFLSKENVCYLKAMLERIGHTVLDIGNLEQFLEFIKTDVKIDLVFNNSWGYSGRNREGLMPALLEAHKIPYTGTDALGCSICLDKLQTKLAAQHLGIRTPAFFLVEPDAERIAPTLPFPLVLKPVAEGSGMGVTLAHNLIQYEQACEMLLDTYHEAVLCEQYVEGYDVVVPVLQRGQHAEAIGAVKITHQDDSYLQLYDLNLKRADACKKVVGQISIEAEREMLEASRRLFDFLQCRDYGRADFKLSLDDKPYFLEFAPLPLLNEKSSVAICCQIIGMDMEDFFDLVIRNAYDRFKLQYKAK